MTDAISYIELSRGMCFGTCPVYDLSYHAGGSCSWRGVHFVERAGLWRADIDEASFAMLVRLVEEIRFFKWRDHYEPRNLITDQPTYRLSVVRNGRSKAVTQYGTDRPPGFRILAGVMDTLADHLVWEPDPAELM